MTEFERALLFAMNAHSGQIRKNGTTPYILHPAEAAAIAATLTDDEAQYVIDTFKKVYDSMVRG